MMPQAQREAAVSAPQDETQWSLAKTFRFLFSYFILWVYPRPIGSLGFEIKYSNPLRDMWHVVVPWVGANWLHLTQFQVDNVPRLPLLTDSQRWQHVVFDFPKILNIQGHGWQREKLLHAAR